MLTVADTTPVDRRVQKGLVALCGGSVGAAFVLAGLGGGHAVAGPVICPLRLLTGVPCPACGLTTSFTEMAGGNLGAAWAAAPIGPLLFVVTVAVACVAAVLLVRRRRLVLTLGRRGARVVGVCVALVAAGSWVYQLTRFGFL